MITSVEENRKKKKKNKKTDVGKKYEHCVGAIGKIQLKHSSLFSLRFSHQFGEIEFWWV